jgi:hypothetical protein
VSEIDSQICVSVKIEDMDDLNKKVNSLVDSLTKVDDLMNSLLEKQERLSKFEQLR